MQILMTVLKWSALLVLIASLLEALLFTLRPTGERYDWQATALSVADFLVRQYPLEWLLPLAFWTHAMDWIWQHRLWTLPMQDWRSWIACFLVQEFCYYWYHRAAHRIRWFWCTHAVHHSPAQLNLSAAYRFGWTGRPTGTLVPFMLAPLLGMPPRIILMMLSLNLLYQFWLHATWIPRLGPLEWVFNTPSAHRVHHACNVEYLDCNYGGVLIIFDRLFGTYRAEKRDVVLRFGLVKPLHPRHLLHLEFFEWQALAKDMRTSGDWTTRLAYLWKPPGWAADGKGTMTEELHRLEQLRERK
ncbi:sterol desaturase family protein [Herbaspirillum sp. 1130]|uniref:sterol desaturase family protein n=1 Tax=Herbaspirillum sp. 1130 TaxID=2806562 RepID=UPI001AE7587E|nr:sterol desaturase family protein [Herbaspirillum sp. 1130]MBP1314184.1 sterol desaturase/sphingolipid hydroxylase (fatty acid hydroxylase superfamily) [Herbaspirillum sp. 1130]